MRIVITGGTGLIGRELARKLAADGYEVVILSRSPQKYRG
ncbi:MAG: SDR family NAD(P)-dependent oxidoreductase, partial [Chloroflexota bacterium]